MTPSPAHCKIVVQDANETSWQDFVESLPAQMWVDREDIHTTTLSGHPVDMAAFLGTLHMLVDLGFPVIACEYEQEDSAASSSSGHAGYTWY